MIIKLLIVFACLVAAVHALSLQKSSRYLKMSSSSTKTVSILGASGYTGAELVRLLSYHPHIKINVLTGDKSSGQEFKTIYPQYAYRTDLPKLTNWESSQGDIEKTDMVFCCLPHGTTQNIISILAKTPSLKV
jgi:N-acetyl-gamma-glutamylphosphate reductase